MIIGSTALKYFGLNRREPKDHDTFYFWGSKPDGDTHQIPKELYDLIPTKNGYATPEAVLTLKMSHLQWDIHWWKTLQDILWLRYKHNIRYDLGLYNTLVKYWKTVHGDKSFLNLNQTKEDFFTDKVVYPMDHDELHKLIVAPDEPTYTKCLKNGAEIAIDRNKFAMLSFTEQIKMFKEEVTVIALERYLLNDHNKVNSLIKAYQLALKKTITNLTKGWASDFIIFNIEHFIHPDFKMFYNVLQMEKNEMIDEFKKYVSSENEQFNAMANKYSNNSYGGRDPWYDDEINLDRFIVLFVDGDLRYNYKHENIEYLADVEVVEQEGGGEGEYCYAILKWQDRFFKLEWSYYSYQGYDYDEAFESLTEVEAKQKVVTVYE